MNRFIRRRPGLIFAVAVTLLVSLTQPPPAYALPERTEMDYYYSGCGVNRTYLGEEGVECDGHHPDTFNNGPYKWRYHYEEVCYGNNNCGESCVTQEPWYMEVCANGSVKYVSAQAFYSGSCSC